MGYEIDYNEEPIIQTTHDGITYKRTGYCCQCGECCHGCPALMWLEQNKRGICADRVIGLKQRCGQDLKTWPTAPEQIQNYPSCTYKFEVVNATN